MDIEQKRQIFIETVCIDPKVGQLAIDARRETCLSCENLTEELQCTSCNCDSDGCCYLPALHQVRWAKCPEGKW